MRIFQLFFLTFAFALQGVSAQKFGYIDSDYILGKLPGYMQAESEITHLSQSWQAEIEKMQLDINELRSVLDMEEILLTERMKAEKMEEIRRKEIELKNYQKKIFGFGGLFFLKKQELIQPLQDKIFDAVKRVAKSNKLAIVFDKAGELIMIYTDPTHDYTDFVLEELGMGDANDTIK